MIRRRSARPAFRSITILLLLLVALLVVGAPPASARTGICLYDCTLEWLQCIRNTSGCRVFGGCSDGSLCQNNHCRDGRLCGRFPATCGLACEQARPACLLNCPDTYLVAVPQELALLGLEERAAKRLLEPIAEADRTLDEAIGGAAPVVGKQLGAFREQLRRMAGKELSKADALRLEQLVLDLEAALAGDGLRQCVSGLLGPVDLQVRAVQEKKMQAEDGTGSQE